MGKAEAIHTMARKGLKQDDPKAYQLLNNFAWTQKDMESVMLDINNGTSPRKAAQKWIKHHQQQVDNWLK